MEEILALRNKLTPEQMAFLIGEYNKRKVSCSKVLLCWLCTFGLGGHRLYLGEFWKAFFMLITFGGFGIWSLLDMFWVNKTIALKNQTIEKGILLEILGKNAAVDIVNQ